MQSRLLPIGRCLFAVSLSFACIAGTAAEEPIKESIAVRSDNLLVQIESDEVTVAELLLRCCWAQSRPAFKYCEEYGVCVSRGEGARCLGRGPAEGRELTCAAEPPQTSSSD